MLTQLWRWYNMGRQEWVVRDCILWNNSLKVIPGNERLFVLDLWNHYDNYKSTNQNINLSRESQPYKSPCPHASPKAGCSSNLPFSASCSAKLKQQLKCSRLSWIIKWVAHVVVFLPAPSSPSEVIFHFECCYWTLSFYCSSNSSFSFIVKQ